MLPLISLDQSPGCLLTPVSYLLDPDVGHNGGLNLSAGEKHGTQVTSHYRSLFPLVLIIISTLATEEPFL